MVCVFRFKSTWDLFPSRIQIAVGLRRSLSVVAGLVNDVATGRLRESSGHAVLVRNVIAPVPTDRRVFADDAWQLVRELKVSGDVVRLVVLMLRLSVRESDGRTGVQMTRFSYLPPPTLYG